MDDRRFDNAVRALARHRSRRGLIGSLLAGGAALLASRLRLSGAAAQSATSRRASGASTPISAIRGSTAPGTGLGPPGPPVAPTSVVAVMTTSAVAARPPALAEPAPILPALRRTAIRVIQAEIPASMPPAGSPATMWRTRVTYRCCTYNGERCGWDGECCGDLACVGGACRPKAGGSGVTSSSGARGAPAVGDRCQTTDQCRRPETGAICEYTVSTGTLAAAGTRVSAPLAPSAVAHELLPVEFANSDSGVCRTTGAVLGGQQADRRV